MKKILLTLGICLLVSNLWAGSCNYVGNKNTKKYHINDGTCRGANRMLENNKICFVSQIEAETLGYSFCKICRTNNLFTNKEI